MSSYDAERKMEHDGSHCICLHCLLDFLLCEQMVLVICGNDKTSAVSHQSGCNGLFA